MRRKIVSTLILASTAAITAAAEGGDSPLERFRLNGELRLRHDLQSSDGALPASGHQDRIAARVGVIAILSERTRGEIRIGSGQGRTSLNQTLGENNAQFANPALSLDRAAIEYSPASGLILLGGRFRNVHQYAGGNDLLFDWDLNFDGWGIQAERKTESMRFFASSTYSWMRKGSTTAAAPVNNGSDIHLLSAQAGAEIPLSSTSRVTTTVGLFRYDQLQGSVPVAARGNSLTGATYAYDYRLGQAGLELGTVTAEIPLTLGADFVRNFAAPREQNAWIAMLRLGNARVKGGWGLIYDYRRVGKDSIVGNLTEVEVVNGQGTDSRAHRAKILYGLDDGMTISLLASKGKSRLTSSPQRDDRYQFDWTIWF